MLYFILNNLNYINSWAPLDPSLVIRGELGLGVWLDLGDYSARPGDAQKKESRALIYVGKRMCW